MHKAPPDTRYLTVSDTGTGPGGDDLAEMLESPRFPKAEQSPGDYLSIDRFGLWVYRCIYMGVYWCMDYIFFLMRGHAGHNSNSPHTHH